MSEDLALANAPTEASGCGTMRELVCTALPVPLTATEP